MSEDEKVVHEAEVEETPEEETPVTEDPQGDVLPDTGFDPDSEANTTGNQV
jgi:hypothetical protein